MSVAPDDKALSSDTRPYDDMATEFFKKSDTVWMPTPITKGLKVNDVCIYSPTDVNRMGTSTKTSWDSFAYALMMNHNVYTHINSVQEANREYDKGKYPNMLCDDNFDKTEVKDVIARVFELDDKDKALELIDQHTKLWMKVVGTRGYVGKKTVNASSQFNSLSRRHNEKSYSRNGYWATVL